MSYPHALRDLALFAEVAKRRSFSRAADALDMPISSLSRRISLFETALGVRLIERTTRRLALTRDGEAYLPRIASLVEEAERTVSALRERAEARPTVLRITLPQGAWAARLLARGAEESELPDHVGIEIATADAVPALASEAPDLVLATSRPSDPSLRLVGSAEDETGLFASPGYFERLGQPARPEDLGRHRLILGRAGATPLRFRSETETISIAAERRLSCGTPDQAIAFAEAGLGVIATGRLDVEEAVQSGRLVPVLPSWRLDARPVYLFRSARRLPAEAEALIDGLSARLIALLTAGVGDAVEVAAPFPEFGAAIRQPEIA